jgi:hypothetical protein
MISRASSKRALGERFHPRRGPRAEEPALTLIPAFPYAAPLEDLRLKK